ncbi:MBL fold metallo-hydrolase [Metaclostridioides mangenotii]|jgi:glyoxylase-like metal-dependent hydrolase (beta-lactamase superfamily II)|uniref:Glyoxylase-like metal-dependent hydrolase (Beta-lactamase superfamily II) n=1 Tax=Metaclostridioides mangenotii TaxID=1540 RepID=A0ABS4E871_9FIRM|nr:MBL fold metallo-hydrolase [Clostridioides mangenotii]MBP1854146.1 glyoxylase-like metal-dependent hydrolase (beta-lactamase superfamily II) [Clostridioides mangenotii]
MASLTLEHIKGNTYYIPLPTIVGVYVDNGDAILVDSGNNKDTSRKILRLLEENNLKVKLIINTHSNADHIGGNSYFKNQTNCEVATTKLESYFTEDPILESSFLYGGNPSKALRNKFLLAKESKVDHIIEADGKILDTDFEAISLPGHYFEMIGIRTPDDVVFIGDSLMPQNIIEKYHLFYLLDIESQFKTLDKLEDLEASYYVPSHYVHMEDIKDLINVNREKMNEILNNIEDICVDPLTIDGVLARVCKLYSIKLDANQYVLLGSTIRSYITYLYENNRVEYIFEEGEMLINKVK